MEFLLMLFLDSGFEGNKAVHSMELARYPSYEECMVRMAEVQNAISDGKMLAMQNFAVKTNEVKIRHICIPVPKQ